MSALFRNIEDELLFTIAIKRKQMIYVGEKRGLTHRETVRISQELDSVIVAYQQMIEKFMSKKTKHLN